MKSAVVASILISVFSLVFMATAAAQSPLKKSAKRILCLQGSYQKLQLHDQVTHRQGKGADSFLSSYQKEKNFLEIIEKNHTAHLKKIGVLAMTPTDIYEEALGKFCTFSPPMMSILIQNYRDITGPLSNAQIAPRCVQASLKRSNSTKGWSCENESAKAKPLGSAGSEGPCISPEVTDYLTWAVNKAIACLNDPIKPIDPIVIYKKLNNETGFSFFSASGGGTGIGQLTSIAVKELSSNTSFVEDILKSERPACAPFKKALSLSPKLENTNNICRWVDSSEGLARNLIYSIGYFLHTRDKLATAMDSAFTKSSIQDARYYNYGALASYGPVGLNAQETVIAAGKNNPRNFEDFLTSAVKTTAYLSQTEEKFREALDNAQIPATEDSCVEWPEILKP